MKKLLSILMLLVAIVTGAKADPTTAEIKFDGAGVTPSDLFTIVSADAHVTTAIQTAPYTYDTSGDGKSLPAPENYTKLLVTTYAAKNKTVTLTTKDSYTDISNIKVNMATSDKGKTKFKIEVSPKADFSDEVTVVKAEDTFTNNGIGSNNKATDVSCDLSTTKTGYVRVTLQATNTTKYTAMSYLKITYTEAPVGPSLSVAPTTAEDFTYVVDNGPSAAQAFTVSLANSEKAVSATLSSTNYEMSKTENGTYSSDAITNLANGSKVYVRLKAGLEKADDYNGTLIFANADVTDDAVVNLSGSVTAQTYAVTYDLKGGNGTTPTQDPVEKDEEITLPAAPTRDLSTFNGWFCSADKQTYAAGAKYTMTAEATTFTAQWTVTTYSSTLDFGAITKAGTTGDNAIEDFLASGNMVISGKGSNSAWEASTANFGFIGYKLKDKGVTVKFMAQAGKKVTITLGSNDGAVTLRKNGVSSSIASHKGNDYFSVIAFDADEDMLVEISTTGDNKKTTTLNKIEIEDALASTDVTVGTTGFATIGLPYATTIPENVTAYSVSATSETAVTLSSAIAAGTKIPANKGFIVVANPGKYTFNQFANGTWQGDAANKLEATGASAKVAAAAGEFYYFAIINADKKKVGFKKCAANANLAANKAYLPGALVPSGSNSLEISFDGETAINGIAESEANAEAPVKVIKNGKLFIGNYNVAGARIK